MSVRITTRRQLGGRPGAVDVRHRVEELDAVKSEREDGSSRSKLRKRGNICRCGWLGDAEERPGGRLIVLASRWVERGADDSLCESLEFPPVIPTR